MRLPRSIIHGIRRFGATRAPAPPVLAGGDVAIVVLNWKRCDETIVCLTSLEAAALEGARVFVVDNGSRDGSIETLRERFPGVQIVALADNRGFAGGCNAGIRAALEAGAGAVLLLNNDTAVAPDFLPPLLAVMNGMPQAAAVSGAVFRADSPEVLDVAWLELYFGHGIVRRRGVNALPGEGFDQVRPIDAGVGSFLLLRTTALRRVGLLDETYFAYHEEVDWCLRARRAGYLVMYQPYARVWHRGSSSTASLGRPPARRLRPRQSALPNPIPLSWNPVRTYLGARNSVRFMRRHGSRWQKLYFVCSSLYAVPLDLLAVTMGQEEEVKLGKWTYRRALASYCVERELGASGGTPTIGTYVRAVVRAPYHLFVALPADLRRAHADGVTAEIVEVVRGLQDGYYNRPLPLERLGLR